jgi:hypothetical protein
MFSVHELLTADTSHTSFRLKVPANTPKEDLTNPQKYREIVRNYQNGNRDFFHFGDKIEILATNGSFYAELLIVGSSRDELFTRLLSYNDFKKSIKKQDESPDFEIVWDEKSKYNVIRKSDKKTMKQGFSSEEEALYFIKNY